MLPQEQLFLPNNNRETKVLHEITHAAMTGKGVEYGTEVEPF